MKIIKYMMQVLVVGSLLTSCVEDADVTAYLTEDQLGNVAQDDPDKTFSAAVAGVYSICILICNSIMIPICNIIISVKRALIT